MELVKTCLSNGHNRSEVYNAATGVFEHLPTPDEVITLYSASTLCRRSVSSSGVRHRHSASQGY